MRHALIVAVLGILLLSCREGIAKEITLSSGDTVQKLLESYKGKRVTVRLGSNEEVTGTVRFVSKELLQLGELAGKEFFDAVIDINRVSAVIIRTRDK